MRGANNASSSLRNPQSSGGVTAAVVIAILILIIAIWAGLVFLLAILIRLVCIMYCSVICLFMTLSLKDKNEKEISTYQIFYSSKLGEIRDREI